jgi:hypothetical protein
MNETREEPDKFYIVGWTNPDPPTVIAGPFTTRGDAEKAEHLIAHPPDVTATRLRTRGRIEW